MTEKCTLEELEEKVRESIGVRLFTVLAWIPDRRALHRAHSSHPEQYPVGGEKTVEVAAGWLDRCIEAKEPYFGPNPAAVREIFADHELIESLHCGSILNVPVLGEDDEVLGVLNILDAEGSYDDESIIVASSLAPLAASSLRELVDRLSIQGSRT